MGKVLITGASGLIGTELSKSLSISDYDVIQLSRSTGDSEFQTYRWNITDNYIDEEALNNIDTVIHLAGAGIAEKRWSDKRKKEIINSRINSSNLLFNKLKSSDNRPSTFISASAIGYYGAVTSEKIFTESDPPGNDFQAEVCKAWEDSSRQFSEIGIRTVQLRFGVVLSENGGVLKKMLLPTKLGIGSALGSGRQYFPWIHINDVVNIIMFFLANTKIEGPYNLVAPSFDTYNNFASILAEVLNKPYFMPNVPEIVLKLAFGEMSRIILEGSRISSDKIIKSGYTFEFTDLKTSIENLLS